MSNLPAVSGIYHLDKDTLLDRKFDQLEKNFKDILEVRLREVAGPVQAGKEEVCAICATGHSTKRCPAIPAYKAMYTE